MTTLTLKHISFEPFDSDKELPIEFDGRMVWLSPNEVNELITFLVEQLREMGELNDFND